MAIVPGVPGLQVTIQVDNKDLTEMEPTLAAEIDVPPNETIRYLKSTPSQAFSIRYLIKDDYPFINQGLTFRHSIDGTLAMNKPWCWPGGKVKAHRKWTARSVKEWINGEEFERKFVFTEISRVEEHTELMCYDTNKIEKLGTIEVIITRWNCTKMKKVSRKYQQANKLDGADIQKRNVLETALKNTFASHQSTLGEATAVAKKKKFSKKLEGEEVDSVENPLAKFTFKYRSIEDLKHLGVLVRGKRLLTPISLLDESEQDEDITQQRMNTKRRQKTHHKRKWTTRVESNERIEYTDDDVAIVKNPSKQRRIEREEIEE